MIAPYRHPDRARGRDIMTKLIASLSGGVPARLIELRRLGRTLKRRASDILAYFATGPTLPTAPPKPSTTAWNTYALRPSIPQSHQLRGQIPPRMRRIQTPTAPCLVKSGQRFSQADNHRQAAGHQATAAADRPELKEASSVRGQSPSSRWADHRGRVGRHWD